MSERLPTGTPVRIKAGRYQGECGTIDFYGVSKFDKKQPVACVHGRRCGYAGYPRYERFWVRPELLEEISRDELAAYLQTSAEVQ